MLRRPPILKPEHIKQVRQSGLDLPKDTNTVPLASLMQRTLVELTDVVHGFFDTLDVKAVHCDDPGLFFELSFELSSVHRKLVDHHRSWPNTLQMRPTSMATSDTRIIFVQ